MPRTPGSRNKRSIEARLAFERARRRIRKELGEDVDPIEVLAQLSLSREESTIRVQAAGKLAPLLYPTLKAIEVNASGEAVDAASQAGQLVLAWDADDVEEVA